MYLGTIPRLMVFLDTISKAEVIIINVSDHVLLVIDKLHAPCILEQS